MEFGMQILLFGRRDQSPLQPSATYGTRVWVLRAVIFRAAIWFTRSWKWRGVGVPKPCISVGGVREPSPFPEPLTYCAYQARLGEVSKTRK